MKTNLNDKIVRHHGLQFSLVHVAGTQDVFHDNKRASQEEWRLGACREHEVRKVWRITRCCSRHARTTSQSSLGRYSFKLPRLNLFMDHEIYKWTGSNTSLKSLLQLHTNIGWMVTENPSLALGQGQRSFRYPDLVFLNIRSRKTSSVRSDETSDEGLCRQRRSGNTCLNKIKQIFWMPDLPELLKC